MFNWFKKHSISQPSYDGPSLTSEHFELKLTQIWTQESTNDVEQFLFTARDGTSITLSCLTWQMSADRLVEAGEALVRARGQALAESLGDFKYELSALNVIPVPYPGLEIYLEGDAKVISYFSRFFGLLTEDFMLQLYVESPASEDINNQRKFEAVLNGLEIKLKDGQTIRASRSATHSA